LFAKSLTPSNLRDGAKASNPDIPLECFRFSAMCREASLRHQPQPQGEGHDRYAADAAEPKRSEPQQALRQRSRILLIWRQ
jgi:hypothetical protein